MTFRIKKVRLSFLFCVPKVIETNVIIEVKVLYAHMCRLFGSQGSNERVQNSHAYIEKALAKQVDPEIIMDLVEPSARVDCEELTSPSVRQISPFTTVFDAILDAATATNDADAVTNAFNCTYLFKFHRKYMHLYPLFCTACDSSCEQSQDQVAPSTPFRITNVAVEGWMAVVKGKILQNQKFPIGKFVRKLYYHHRGLVKQFKGLATSTTSTRKRKSSPVSEWGPKGKRRTNMLYGYFECNCHATSRPWEKR